MTGHYLPAPTPSRPDFPPPFNLQEEKTLEAVIMGGFDDVESHSPTRYSSMLGRGVGEARRRIVLVALLASFFLLTLVAFRRQDTIKDVVSKGLHRPANATASLEKQDTQADLQEITKPKDASLGEKYTSDPSSKPEVIYKSPILGNGERSLTQDTLEALHNSSLGVSRRFSATVTGICC